MQLDHSEVSTVLLLFNWLLQELHLSRKPGAPGLVFVELGTADAQLSRWLALNAFGVLATMHQPQHLYLT